MNFQRVTVDDAGLANEIIREGPARQQQKHQYDGGSMHAHERWHQWLSQIARIEFRPLLEQLERRQVLRSLGVVKLRPAEPASLEALPEQDRIHLPGKFINCPDAVVLNDFTSCVEGQAVEFAKGIDLIPMLSD